LLFNLTGTIWQSGKDLSVAMLQFSGLPLSAYGDDSSREHEQDSGTCSNRVYAHGRFAF